MELDKRAYWIWLQRALNAGSSKPRHILRFFSTPEEFYHAGPHGWRMLGIFTQRDINALRAYTPQDAQALLAYCEQLGQTVLTPEDAGYPEPLWQIHNPPSVLYVRGELPDFSDTLSISIVGTRKATESGKRIAHSIAYGLAKGGAAIISGGALGIDTAAHRGALLAGGKTVCVLGCGIGYNYLMANASLRDTIAHSGALVTEYPPDTPSNPGHFPVRNRLIAGLSAGPLVVEAAAKSGSLITADNALNQGRDVFAVPGNVGSPVSSGVNNLLFSNSAKPVRCANDILEEYLFRFPGKIHLEESTESVMLIETAPEQKTPAPETGEDTTGLSPDAAALFGALCAEPQALKDLCAKAEIPAARALAAVTELELCGRIRGYSGRRYARH